MTTNLAIGDYLESLRDAPPGDVFNPWFDVDPRYDKDAGCPAIRREQLGMYLKERVNRATHLLIGEAIGYQGGHFSGMAMTSERILLGHKEKDGVKPGHVFNGLKPKRTSKPEIRPNGFSENTATIVWKAIIKSGINPHSVILWNTFPWHPYQNGRGMLTNRTPAREEFEWASPFLGSFLGLFPKCQALAVGKQAWRCLTDLGITSTQLRHPAHGGASKFREGLHTVFK